ISMSSTSTAGGESGCTALRRQVSSSAGQLRDVRLGDGVELARARLPSDIGQAVIGRRAVAGINAARCLDILMPAELLDLLHANAVFSHVNGCAPFWQTGCSVMQMRRPSWSLRCAQVSSGNRSVVERAKSTLPSPIMTARLRRRSKTNSTQPCAPY